MSLYTNHELRDYELRDRSKRGLFLFLILVSIAVKAQISDTIKVKYRCESSPPIYQPRSFFFEHQDDVIEVTIIEYFRSSRSGPMWAVRTLIDDTIDIKVVDASTRIYLDICIGYYQFPVSIESGKDTIFLKLDGKLYKVPNSVVTSNPLSGIVKEGVVQVFPNPFIQELCIVHAGEFRYRLMDISGETIALGDGNGEMKVGQDVGKGIYFLKVMDTGGDKVFKIIKERALCMIANVSKSIQRRQFSR